MWFRKKKASGPKRLMIKLKKAKKPKGRFALWLSAQSARISKYIGKSWQAAKSSAGSKLKKKLRIPDSGLPMGIIVQGVLAIILIAVVSWKLSETATNSWQWLKSLSWSAIPWTWVLGVAALLLGVWLIARLVKRRRQAPAPEGQRSVAAKPKKNYGSLAANVVFGTMVLATLIFFGWRGYYWYAKLNRDKEIKEASNAAKAQEEHNLIMRLSSVGVPLPKRDTSFIYTVHRGEGVYYVEPRGYCTHVQTQNDAETVAIESQFGTTLAGPLENDIKVTGLYKYFKIEAYSSEESVVKVWSYPQKWGECKDPTRASE